MRGSPKETQKQKKKKKNGSGKPKKLLLIHATKVGGIPQSLVTWNRPV